MSRETMEQEQPGMLTFDDKEFIELEFHTWLDNYSAQSMVSANEWSYDLEESDEDRYGWRQNKFLNECVREIEKEQIALFHAERATVKVT